MVPPRGAGRAGPCKDLTLAPPLAPPSPLTAGRLLSGGHPH